MYSDDERDVARWAARRDASVCALIGQKPTTPLKSHRRATVRGVDQPIARPRPLRLTQARIGDTLHDGNGTRVAIVNAFTTMNRNTDATVRAVDYQVVGSPEQFRMYSDDADDAARWTRV